MQGIYTLTKNKLLTGPHPGKRGPETGLAISEIMTILIIMFHEVRFRDFKRFYTGFFEVYWRGYFPNLPSYSRFITLMKRAIFPMIETVIGHLKHHYQIWHTRHRSVLNAMTLLVSALATSAIEPLKISAIKRLELMA